MMRAAAKKIATLVGFALTSAWGRSGRDLLVPTYHRIAQAPDSSDPLKVSVATFDRQIRYFRDNYAPITGDDLLDAIEGRRALPDRACLVTFDDGWEDNYTLGWPILKSHGVRGLIFLSTDYIGTGKRFWHVRLRDILRQPSVRAIANRAITGIPDLLRKIGTVGQLAADERGDATNELIEWLKQFPATRVEAALESLESELGLSGADRGACCDGMLSWLQVSEMANDGMCFGSHGMSHAILTQLADNDIRTEVLGSMKVLEERLHRRVPLLAYPNGDYDLRTLRIVEDAGVLAGFTCVSGVNRGLEERLVLRRVGMREASANGFGSEFSPMFFAAELAGTRQRMKQLFARR